MKASEQENNENEAQGKKKPVECHRSYVVLNPPRCSSPFFCFLCPLICVHAWTFRCTVHCSSVHSRY